MDKVLNIIAYIILLLSCYFVMFATMLFSIVYFQIWGLFIGIILTWIILWSFNRSRKTLNELLGI
jgi:positive regulator of sigma E activity